MSKLMIFVSATIVLFFSSSLSFAAPDNVAPASEVALPSWPEPPPIENMMITPPAPVDPHHSRTPRANARYYAYRQALTFRGGLASDFPKLDFRETVLGFQYLFPKFLSPKLEAGADLYEEGRGHLHAGLRWYWFERGYFRPSGKLGLDHLAEADERLATLTRIDNYYARISGALEYVVWDPYSLRLEHELLINFAHQQTLITLGISRGW